MSTPCASLQRAPTVYVPFAAVCGTVNVPVQSPELSSLAEPVVTRTPVSEYIVRATLVEPKPTELEEIRGHGVTELTLIPVLSGPDPGEKMSEPEGISADSSSTSLPKKPPMYTSPAESTAIPSGSSSPENGNACCEPKPPEPFAGSSSTSPFPLPPPTKSTTYTSPVESTATPCGSPSPMNGKVICLA